jgi:hypothetical protein|mmetsp:Transcript_37682/g.110400  ORF Transcript_37682/g.110400 Transcript_37682/m.110400 type:complete len:94 (-) Transcript_37682:32-313(-)|eukprot:5510670-Prymnesium_polylepis.2
MDNFFTTSPVLTLARSLWYKTDAVVFDESIARGLARMLDPSESPWPEWRKMRQRQAVCWYRKMALNTAYTPEENVAVLQRQLDAMNMTQPLVL